MARMSFSSAVCKRAQVTILVNIDVAVAYFIH